jgi:hypothetical protein
MMTDTVAVALRTRLEAIVKEAEEKALVEEEETKAAALEQTATAARQRLPSSSAAAPASQVIPATSSSYKTQSSPIFTFRRLRSSTSASW